jgi:hypothetical protein
MMKKNRIDAWTMVLVVLLVLGVMGLVAIRTDMTNRSDTFGPLTAACMLTVFMGRKMGDKARSVANWFALILVTFAVYALSLGPVLRFCGASPSSGWQGVPAPVRLFYNPMTSIGGMLPHTYEDFILWWIKSVPTAKGTTHNQGQPTDATASGFRQ